MCVYVYDIRLSYLTDFMQIVMQIQRAGLNTNMWVSWYDLSWQKKKAFSRWYVCHFWMICGRYGGLQNGAAFFYRALLQKRPIILSILVTVGLQNSAADTGCVCVCVCVCVIERADCQQVYVRHDSLICETWSIICETWLIHVCDVTALGTCDVYVCIYVYGYIGECICIYSNINMLIHMRVRLVDALHEKRKKNQHHARCATCIYICVYIHIYIPIYIHACIYIYTCSKLSFCLNARYICMCTYLYTCTYIYTYVYMYIYVYIYMYVYMYIYMLICICIYKHIYTYIYVCVCACVCVYTYIPI